MGHLTYPRVELVPKELFALDTGAAKGGRLTAVVLPGFDLVSVPATRDYHAEALAAWKRAQSAGAAPVGDRPLANLVETLGKSAPDHAELAEECVPLIALLRERLADTAAAAAHRFGEIPPPGPARGEYYVSRRRDIGDAELYGLVQLSAIRDAPDLLVRAARTFPRVSMHDLARIAAEAIPRISDLTPATGTSVRAVGVGRPQDP